MLMSPVLFAPTAETRSLSFPSRNFPSASNRQEVTITWLAPAEIHSFAFPGVMPPPTWRPPGHAARASRAARSLPGPSLITWPPVQAVPAVQIRIPCRAAVGDEIGAQGSAVLRQGTAHDLLHAPVM